VNTSRSLLTDIVAILAIFTAGGAALDALLLNRRKKVLYGSMELWWVQLDDTRVPELHQHAAMITLGILKRLFRSKTVNARLIITVALFSYSWTFVALLIGFMLGLHATMAQMHVSPLHLYSYISLWWFGLIYDGNVILYSFLVLPSINFLFDGLTVWLAMVSLKKVERTSSCRALPILFALLVVAAGLAIYCFWAGLISAQLLNVSLSSRRLSLNPADIIGAWRNFLQYAQNGSLSLFAVTTLAPLSLYIAVLGFLITAKALLSAAKWLVSRYLELAVDKPLEKFAPFTLFGVSSGVIASILTAVAHFGGW
jgi:hypothetical protein